MPGAHAIFYDPDGNEVGRAPLEADCIIDAKSYTMCYTARTPVQISYVLVKVLPWDDYKRHNFKQMHSLDPGDTLNVKGDIHWDEPQPPG